MSADYDDPTYSYLTYWNHRQYEHGAEVLAISRLLKGVSVDSAADVGGGYGRLTALLKQFAKEVMLIEPSAKQRGIGSDFLKDPSIKILEGSAESLPLADSSTSLLVVVRVVHHTPKIEPVLRELWRVLEPGGLLILEVANSTHFKARVKSWLTGKSIPKEPRVLNSQEDDIPFVNHHPETVEPLFAEVGFKLEDKLSVSNVRLPGIKRILPTRAMLQLESPLQRFWAPLNFGPSLFYKLRKPAK